MEPSEHHLTPPPPSKVAARYTLPSLYLIQSVFQSLYLVLFFSTVPYPSQPAPRIHSNCFLPESSKLILQPTEGKISKSGKGAPSRVSGTDNV